VLAFVLGELLNVALPLCYLHLICEILQTIVDVCQKKYIENSILYVGGSYVVRVEEDLLFTRLSL
jgi:hypothetical protein